MDFNLLLDTDSYKGSHWLQYPPDLTAMGAYMESRGGENPDTLFFGLQMLLQDTLERPVTRGDVEGPPTSGAPTACPSITGAGSVCSASTAAACPCGSGPSPRAAACPPATC
ncbi:nicotinamide phosphoribosyltransferase domain-containing protein [Cyanobium gracile]|uniref:nicotinamide phosphoribosyltransferase domain-containing protein n=1 Tax=Cyanobium gracile TaxID=59930 RepID=UPI0002F15A06|nr:nicotinamide phosphoribosyltransferase domain-containing protein [Cyanobium gracile]